MILDELHKPAEALSRTTVDEESDAERSASLCRISHMGRDRVTEGPTEQRKSTSARGRADREMEIERWESRRSIGKAFGEHMSLF
jgi:hypothetical protein